MAVRYRVQHWIMQMEICSHTESKYSSKKKGLTDQSLPRNVKDEKMEAIQCLL